MELKLPKAWEPYKVIPLLIVPYGIETLHQPTSFHIRCLLIVPYGIETCSRTNPSTECTFF